MTRRGTLAYYLAAWVIGCFVTAVLFFSVTGGAGAAALLLTYFFTLIVGATDLLVFAFLLRRLMGRLGTHRIVNWALAGAALSSLLMLLFAWISSRRPAAWGSGTLEAITNVLVGGAEVLRQTGFWQAPVDGAVTAVVLCLVDRAFDRPTDAPESAQPAA